MRGHHGRESWRGRYALPTGGLVLIVVGFTLLGPFASLIGAVAAANGAPPAGTIAPLPPRRDRSAPGTDAAPIPVASPLPSPQRPGSVLLGDVAPLPAARPLGPIQPGNVAPLPAPRPMPTATTFARGVNLPAPSFNAPQYVPGVYGTNYTYPTGSDLDYFMGKGFTLFRLPFSWERMQPSLNGPLDATQLGYMDSFIAAAHARNARIILSQQNFDRYRIQRTPPPYSDSQNIVVGSTAAVPIAAFADFWQKVATHYATETAIVGYDLTNEPHDTGGRWPATAQAATTAIRQVDHAHTIVVEGDNYAAASTWTTYNESLSVSDPDNNLVYSAHEYFDADGSGAYSSSYDAEGAYPTIGVDRAAPYIDWLRRHGFRGYFGEYGVPNTDARWLVVLDNFLTAIDAAGLDGTYWAGGPFLSGYPLSINPNPMTGQDAPQMATLVRHLGR